MASKPFSGSNLFAFEATETKLKEFLGMPLSKTDSINMVEGPGGHPDTSRTSKLFVRGYKGGNNWPQSFNLANKNYPGAFLRSQFSAFRG